MGKAALLLVLCAALVGTAAAHSNLIYPKPRNAIDSLLPEWSGGKAPYVWQPYGDAPCACTNGTSGADPAPSGLQPIFILGMIFSLLSQVTL